MAKHFYQQYSSPPSEPSLYEVSFAYLFPPTLAPKLKQRRAEILNLIVQDPRDFLYPLDNFEWIYPPTIPVKKFKTTRRDYSVPAPIWPSIADTEIYDKEIVRPPLPRKKLAACIKNLLYSETPIEPNFPTDFAPNKFEALTFQNPRPKKRLSTAIRNLFSTNLNEYYVTPAITLPTIFDSLPPIRPVKIKHHRPGRLFYNDGFLFVPPPVTEENAGATHYRGAEHPMLRGRIASSGQFIGTHNPSSNSITLTANRAYYVPIIIPNDLIIDQLSIYITTTDSVKQARLGIFSILGGKVADLITSNILQFDSTGPRDVSVAAALGQGMYALAILSESGAAEIRRCSINFSMLGYSNRESTTENSHWYDDKSAFSDGFSDDPTVTLATGNAPHIYARVR